MILSDYSLILGGFEIGFRCLSVNEFYIYVATHWVESQAVKYETSTLTERNIYTNTNTHINKVK